jgi:hypothetical protein
LSFNQIEQQLGKLTTVPTFGTPEYAKWLGMADALEFLVRTRQGLAPAYISANGFYLYSILVREEKLVGDYVEDALEWNFPVPSGWGYGTVSEDGKHKKHIFPPLDHTSSQVINGGEPLFFLRSFEGYRENKSYTEFNQPIAHILEAHWVPERYAHCRINELGDFDDLAVMKRTALGIICAIDLTALERYMFLTDTVLMRVFDVTRCHDWGTFDGREQGRGTSAYRDQSNEIYARRTIAAGPHGNEAAWLRGFQIIRRTEDNDILMQELWGVRRKPKQYETFIAYDWKHKQVRECSCAPEQLASYFVESDLPFETTPAFFRAEVLLKYKNDPDKYDFDQRMISCRGAWSLRYDINEEGQVHAFLCDLGDLPHQEQLYWKSFNENPKSGISKRSFKSDFLAEWDTEYDPLQSLEQILSEFPLVNHRGKSRAIWKIKAKEKSLARLAYVVTNSTKEWEDQILELAKILVDGFDKSAISDLAKTMRCFNVKLGSLKLLQRCVTKRKVAEETIHEIFDPLEELWKLRSSIVAHPGSAVPKQDLKQHYRELLERCDRSLRLLSELIESHVLDIRQTRSATKKITTR